MYDLFEFCDWLSSSLDIDFHWWMWNLICPSWSDLNECRVRKIHDLEYWQEVVGEEIKNIIDFGMHIRCLIKCVREGIVENYGFSLGDKVVQMYLSYWWFRTDLIENDLNLFTILGEENVFFLRLIFIVLGPPWWME